MVFQLQPVVFGVAIVVAVGTLIYTMWNSPQTYSQQNSYNHRKPHWEPTDIPFLRDTTNETNNDARMRKTRFRKTRDTTGEPKNDAPKIKPRFRKTRDTTGEPKNDAPKIKPRFRKTRDTTGEPKNDAPKIKPRFSGSNNCIICQKHITEITMKKVLSCGHSFHRKCIDTWLSMDKLCPICRQVRI